MSAGPSRGFDSPAPGWAALIESSHSLSAAPSEEDDELCSSQDMRDELDPTPPAPQNLAPATKKRRKGASVSDDESAAAIRLAKKAKVPQPSAAAGGQADKGISAFRKFVPMPQPEDSPTRPLDNVRPRIQVAKKQARRPKHAPFVYEVAKQAGSSSFFSASQGTFFRTPASAPSRPRAATQQALESPSKQKGFAQHRDSHASSDDDVDLSSSRQPHGSHPAGDSKGKSIDRGGPAGGANLRRDSYLKYAPLPSTLLAKSKQDVAPAKATSASQSDRSAASRSTATGLQQQKEPTRSTSPFTSTSVVAPFKEPARPVPSASTSASTSRIPATAATVPVSISSTKPKPILKPTSKLASIHGISAPVASSSRAPLPPLQEARTKKRTFPSTSASSDEHTGATASIFKVPDERSQRKAMGLRKVPVPTAGTRISRTGRWDSDSSIDAEEIPVRRKKKKVKLAHKEKRVDVDTGSLTATQQRRKAVVAPPVDVIELSSDSDKPVAPPKPKAKRSRVSAPVKVPDIINISDSEGKEAPPVKSTQSVPAIVFKYDANGSILIDDDDDEETVEATAALVQPSVERRVLLQSPQADLQVLTQDEAVPERRAVEPPETGGSLEPVRSPVEDDSDEEDPNDIAIESQMQELDLGKQGDTTLQELPYVTGDSGEVKHETQVDALPEPTKGNSEDRELAISTDVQLHISPTRNAQPHSPCFVSPSGLSQSIPSEPSGAGGLSARALEKAPAHRTGTLLTPSFPILRRDEVDGKERAQRTTSLEVSTRRLLLQLAPSRWIARHSSISAKSSKIMYGGPGGFFKDVYANREKSRSSSQSTQEVTAVSSPPKVLDPILTLSSPLAGPASPLAPSAVIPSNSLSTVPMTKPLEDTEEAGWDNLSLTYPETRSASAKSKSRSPGDDGPLPEKQISESSATLSAPAVGPVTELGLGDGHAEMDLGSDPPTVEEPNVVETLEVVLPVAARISLAGMSDAHPDDTTILDMPAQEINNNVSIPSPISVPVPQSTSRSGTPHGTRSTPASISRPPSVQVPIGATLQEVINAVWLEKSQQAKPQFIDLTLDDDDDEAPTSQSPPAPSTTGQITVSTKAEIILPPVSVIGKPKSYVHTSGPTAPAVGTVPEPTPSVVTPRKASLDLDVIRQLRSKLQKQKAESGTEPQVHVTTTLARAFLEMAPSTSKAAEQSLANAPHPVEAMADPVEPSRATAAAVTLIEKNYTQQGHDDDDGIPLHTHWSKRKDARVEMFEEAEYGPPGSLSPSQDEDSEQEIASYLDVVESEVAERQTNVEPSPPRRQLRPRNISRGSTGSVAVPALARTRRSTRSGSSSVGPAELSDEFNPTFVEPRITNGSDDDLDMEPTLLDQVANKFGFKSLTWDRDHQRMAKEFANAYVLAKDLPHELQDRINALPPSARRAGDMQVRLFEQAIIENTQQDEPHAPPIRIVNNIDDELTPPFEFHYSNLMWHGEGVPRPGMASLRGCGCFGPCDPKSKTCDCIKRQKKYYESGFLYHDDRRLKGTLKDHEYPIFECNDFCGCSDDCPNRVVQHGRKYALEIRKTRDKGWGVFAGPKKIPKNTYLGIYAGEYLVEAEAERRGAVYNKFGRTYLFDVDFYYLKEGNDEWTSMYSVDAYHAGNFTRYMNHSCDPNCCINPCYINESNLDKPLLTIFTQRDVAPGEELCFSYYGNGDDEDEAQAVGEVRSFDDAVYVRCRCGAKTCRGRMWRE